jgi:hypothetical protein
MTGFANCDDGFAGGLVYLLRTCNHHLIVG